MSSDLPDTTGYALARARELLRAAGVESVEVVRVGALDELAPGKRAMVVRQRAGADGVVELTAAAEWRTPTSQDG